MLWDYSDLHTELFNRQFAMLISHIRMVGGEIMGDSESGIALKKSLKRLSD